MLQRSMMDVHTDGKPLLSHLRRITVLVLLLLLTHHCRGQSQLISSSQPIVANLGGDIILPCYLEPAVNVAGLTLEWTRPDMDPRFVHVMRLGHEMMDKKHELFKGRTSMFTDELKNGNISMKLSNVQLSDQGKYRCFIPKLDRQTFVQLVFGPSSPPVISLSGLDGQSGGVVLQCESAGWYPEPEVLWLDAEGKLLSAGPPETVRGPDDLYTVSSRVTVEKRPSNSFTCRVQHHNTTHTTQTHFHVPDAFFISEIGQVAKAKSSSSPAVGFNQYSLKIFKCNEKLLLEKSRREEELKDLKREMESKETDRKRADAWRNEEKLKETRSQLEIQRTENSQLKREWNNQPHDKKGKEEEPERFVNEEMKNKKAESFERSYNSQLMEPHRTPPSAQTSDSGFNIQVNQPGKYIRLRNTSTEEKHLGQWELHLQVNNKNPVMHRFHQSSYIKAGGFVTMWAAGYGSNDSNTDLKWKDLKPWSSGDSLQFTLYSHTREIQYEHCV
ncbi:Butyrophilin subfamily 3 member A3 [Dissostichus eleginoides]|uniref:Butyrophilin subfamily 3 member A3 n=1 Tax=Dissostichus eleginoides TaxID=100907 RepID=A0AAD9F924_DISEL|nr:Butyrophilin subfamily 3 member A3 [Dissostichus eleginoides]